MQITDPASELAHLVEWLLELHPTNAITCNVIAAAIGIAGNSPEYNELVAAVSTRVRRLRVLSEELVAQTRVPEKLASELSRALGNLQAIFSMASQGKRWDTVKQEHVAASDGFALHKLGHIIRPIRTLRTISADERSSALDEVKVAREKLLIADDFEPWLKSFLAESLERLELMLRYLEFFGHTATRRDIAALQMTLVVAERRRIGPNAMVALASIAGVILTFVGLYKAPTDVKDGWPFWEQALDDLRSGTKALAPHSISLGRQDAGGSGIPQLPGPARK